MSTSLTRTALNNSMSKDICTSQQGAHEHTPAQTYPPYVCHRLIEAYLRPEQTAVLRPILRILKKRYQIELCTHLMDYIETGVPRIPEHTTLGAIFMQLTRVGLPEFDNPEDKSIIRPLRNSNHI